MAWKTIIKDKNLNRWIYYLNKKPVLELDVVNTEYNYKNRKKGYGIYIQNLVKRTRPVQLRHFLSKAKALKYAKQQMKIRR